MGLIMNKPYLFLTKAPNNVPWLVCYLENRLRYAFCTCMNQPLFYTFVAIWVLAEQVFCRLLLIRYHCTLSKSEPSHPWCMGKQFSVCDKGLIVPIGIHRLFNYPGTNYWHEANGHTGQHVCDLLALGFTFPHSLKHLEPHPHACFNRWLFWMSSKMSLIMRGEEKAGVAREPGHLDMLVYMIIHKETQINRCRG